MVYNLEGSNLYQCKRKLEEGHFTVVIKVLSSSGITPFSPNTLNTLDSKHPFAPPPVLPSIPCYEEALCVTKEEVLSSVHSFPKVTSCGRDGLRAQHLMDMLGGVATAIADNLLCSITKLFNMFLDGKCPCVLGSYIASAPLTPLVKPGGGIRPIAVGTVWRRLVSKIATSVVGKTLNTYFEAFQFGVGTQEVVKPSFILLISSSNAKVM